MDLKLLVFVWGGSNSHSCLYTCPMKERSEILVSFSLLSTISVTSMKFSSKPSLSTRGQCDISNSTTDKVKVWFTVHSNSELWIVRLNRSQTNFVFNLTVMFKGLGSVRCFNVFEKSLIYSPRLPLYIKSSNVKHLQFKIKGLFHFNVFYLKIRCNLRCNLFLWWQNCSFSIIIPVFSVTWSSEIIPICWETFLIIIINVENGYAA